MKILKKTWLLALLACSTVTGQTDLGVAQYNGMGELLLPDNLDQWIMMGASLGGDYSDEPFDPATPASIGVVKMEPAAYHYFLDNGEFANGTMFLLSFFQAETKSEPQLQGFVQGEMDAQEIHVIDSGRYSEGRGFYLYPEASMTSAAKVPDGSECVVCHSAEGDYNATFTQFYPPLRDLLPD